MRRLLVLMMVASVLVIPAGASAAPDKQEVCHASKSSDPIKYTLRLVTAKSFDKHIAHGDGVPDGFVPGSGDSLVFTADCGQVDANTAPVASDATLTISSGGSATIDLSTLVTDAEQPSDTLSYAFQLAPGASASAFLSGSDLIVTCGQVAPVNVDSQIDYRATDDGGLLSNIAAVVVTCEAAPNTPPEAQDHQSVEVEFGFPETIFLSDFAFDAEQSSDTLTYTILGDTGPPITVQDQGNGEVQISCGDVVGSNYYFQWKATDDGGLESEVVSFWVFCNFGG